MTGLTRKVVWTVTCAYAALLAGVCLLPSGDGVLGGWDAAITPTWQNALHVPAFAVLAALAILAASGSFRIGLAGVLWITLGCCAYGVLLELAQAAIPGRTGSLTDVLLNAAGVAIGSLAVMWWRKTIRRAEPTRALVDTVSETGKPARLEAK